MIHFILQTWADFPAASRAGPAGGLPSGSSLSVTDQGQCGNHFWDSSQSMGESFLSFGLSGSFVVPVRRLLAAGGLWIAGDSRFMESKGKGKMKAAGFSAVRECSAWR